MTDQKPNTNFVDIDKLLDLLDSVEFCYMPAKPDPEDKTRPEMISMNPDDLIPSLKINRLSLESHNAMWRVRMDQGVLYIEERIHD